MGVGFDGLLEYNLRLACVAFLVLQEESVVAKCVGVVGVNCNSVLEYLLGLIYVSSYRF